MDEKNKAIKRLSVLTHQMAESREKSIFLAQERRELMFQLNRDFGVTYQALSYAAQINESRVYVEMRKARVFAGELLPANA